MPRPLGLPQLPQPSNWFPVLALGRFAMVIEKQTGENTGEGEMNGLR